jgi:hypothetical protein
MRTIYKYMNIINNPKEKAAFIKIVSGLMSINHSALCDNLLKRLQELATYKPSSK